MVRIDIEIPDEVHARLKMLASAEGKGFYERLKENICQTCPDEKILLEILKTSETILWSSSTGSMHRYSLVNSS